MKLEEKNTFQIIIIFQYANFLQNVNAILEESFQMMAVINKLENVLVNEMS